MLSTTAALLLLLLLLGINCFAVEKNEDHEMKKICA